MNKNETLHLALETLEEGAQGTRPLGVATLEAIAAIKAALQTKDEPAAWYRDEDGIRIYYDSKVWADATPLYTAPPQRKPLTDEEIAAISKATHFQSKPVTAFARAVEAAHGIKENT